MHLHEMKHRCEYWYLELNKRYIMKQMFFVWVLSLRRKCYRNTLTTRAVIYWFHRCFKFFISYCDLVDAISMWFDCKKFTKCVNEMKKMRDDREIDNQTKICKTSNVRIAFASIHRWKNCKFERIDFLCNSENFVEKSNRFV